MIRAVLHKTLRSNSGQVSFDIDLQIEAGQLVVLYGASGVGKTSTLRMLAGLMKPDAGHIGFGTSTWFDAAQKINLKPQKRPVGLLFQDYALFPNMTVRKNLEFALPKKGDANRIEELLEVMDLTDLENRLPATLSGGQQQRVALARTLVPQPELLLLDEPLSALDDVMRLKLQDYLHKLHHQYGLTTILISHDIAEIIRLADRVFVMEDGKITRQGTANAVFKQQKVSGKFQFTGQVLSLEKQDFLYIISVIVGKEIIKVVADEMEAQKLKPGDSVLVASKAFNPIIRKIE